MPCLFALALLLLSGTDAVGQWGGLGSDTQFELSDSVSLDRADSRVAAEIEQAKAYVADRQWGRAVAALRQIMEQSGERLWPVTPRRFVTVRDYGNLQLAALPPPGLAVYRAQVDPVAGQWYAQGIAARDPALLRRVVREAFASSVGDEALVALGELALDRGDASEARAWWERILPADEPGDAAHTWLSYPDTNLDPAAVRARLVLASILEGSRRRAAAELAQFERLHPRARGPLAGREVDYAEALRELLADSARWPERPADGGWPTFAGAPSRTRIARGPVDPGGVAWRFTWDERPETQVPAAGVRLGAAVADVWSVSGPACHPVRVGPLVLAGDGRRIWALQLASGKPAWGNTAEVFGESTGPAGSWLDEFTGTVGRPAYTMTVFDGKLYARLGNPWTARPRHAPSSPEESYLVAIDLAGEGRLLWKAVPESADWAFEGSPLSDGRNVYVALRRADIRPQAHVGCYDAQTGRLRWRRFVSAAQTPAQNIFPEVTNNLLTLAGDTLYYNTNLGAVAALATDGGQVQWVSLYPRRRSGDLAKLDAHWGRSLNPCVYHRGLVLVAPTDSRRIFALDALTGQILWQTPSAVEDVVHLLGVAGENLVACGRRVYWIGLDRENQGRIRHVWPRDEALALQGRGVLVDRRVYVPADDRVFVLDQHSGELARTIELGPKGLSGGNLLVADDVLLVTTPRELVALGRPATRENMPNRGPALAAIKHVEQARPLNSKSQIEESQISNLKTEH